MIDADWVRPYIDGKFASWADGRLQASSPRKYRVYTPSSSVRPTSTKCFCLKGEPRQGKIRMFSIDIIQAKERGDGFVVGSGFGRFRHRGNLHVDGRVRLRNSIGWC